MFLTITREEHQSLKAEFGYLCGLVNEANRLWNDLDFREGIALLEGNQKHIEQCKRLKKVARQRAHRRSCKGGVVYEEMEQEAFDTAVLCGTPIPRFAPTPA